MEKPFSQACENNKGPILEVLRGVYRTPVTVLEIGSGTGQHACHFARHLPHVEWQPTEMAVRVSGIRLWLADENLVNIREPLILDVTDPVWPVSSIEALFTANTLHIMSWQSVRVFFHRMRQFLELGASLCIYGPLNYCGEYTSDSNARFDQWLKSRDPESGIRDFADVVDLARLSGLALLDDVAMPANNRLLILNKVS